MGSSQPGTDIIGTIGIDKLEEIARTKLPDLNCEARWSHILGHSLLSLQSDIYDGGVCELVSECIFMLVIAL